ncbi:MAG: class B sortase [Eubacterium sp.]|nr:class B sortase [Eubacterium sp.]
MKDKRSLFFIIPAFILIVILCYALIRAMLIYIPLRREKNDFNRLREAIHITADDQKANKGDKGQDSKNNSSDQALSPFKELAEENSDFTGWLSIADTEIDYPVMKSAEDDPEYYLHRDFKGEKSYSGCLFIGGGCHEDSLSFIIYGHNMSNETMFGGLDKYGDYEYAVSHKDIRFITPEEKRVYRVFAAFQTKVNADRDDVFKYYEEIGDLSQEEYEDTVESIRRMSVISTPSAPQYPAQLLLLSTCSYHTEDGRFVVAAYRIK